jgi:hypothetical protein
MLRAVRVTDYMLEEASVTVLTHFSPISNPDECRERDIALTRTLSIMSSFYRDDRYLNF